MSFSQKLHRLHSMSALTLSLLILSAQAHAQALAAGSSTDAVGTASATTNNAGPRGIVPFTPGLNASLGSSFQHDSSNGWSTILTPGLAYRLSPFLSLSAAAPIYASINVETNTGTTAKPVYTSTTKHGALGDASLAAHLDLHPDIFDYSATFSLGLPCGSTADGLGAGKATYDFNNHVEKSFGIFSPDIEFGIGTSNNLIQARVRKSYTTLGALSHFQAGTSIDLPLNMSLDAELYEELPLKPATIFSAGKGKKKTTAAATGNAEDNGFTTSLDLPVTGHVTFSGFYNHSLRNQEDVAGISLTFLMKAPPNPARTIH